MPEEHGIITGIKEKAEYIIHKNQPKGKKQKYKSRLFFDNSTIALALALAVPLFPFLICFTTLILLPVSMSIIRSGHEVLKLGP